MKKITVLCAISLMCCMAQTQSIPAYPEAPAWERAFDNIIAAIEGLGEALTNDSLLYGNWRSCLETLREEFDEADIVRQDIFESIRSGITETKTALENARTASDISASASQAREKNLLHQLAALKLETQVEIAYLNRLISELSKELADTQTAYNTLIKTHETKTDALIKSLSIARDNYEAMVIKRTDFLHLLNTLVVRTKSNLQTTITQAEDVGQQICALTDAIIES